jgi:hypothetical protein
MIRTFPNNAIFKNDNATIHTVGSVQSWSEDHEGELPWPTQSPHLNDTEPLCVSFEVRNRFPPPASLKQLEDVRQEEWYKISLEAVQNLWKSIPRRTAAVLKAKGGPT